MSEKLPATYILASRPNGVLYTGVTSNLVKRVWQHKNVETVGFTAKYHVHLLVWFERHENMEAAILREKQIKAGSRAKKIALIEAMNPYWKDLYPEIC
ncbi:MAG: Excinuclease subunit domain protein [Proteobacteria bacterium]|nr:Excinuclease subunit domain protein [Pseudomonadota bacterium]